MRELVEQTPAEIDGQLAQLWAQEQIKRHYLAAERRSLASGRYPYQQAEFEKAIAAYKAKIAEIRAEAEPLETEFVARGGWRRYFLVNNPGGRVHRERDCQTCFDTTQFAWLPELSGCDESEMVAQYGEMACTVCFPAAPTMRGYADGQSALARYSAEEKAARAAAKAQKAADRDAKAITAPGGTPLRVRGDTIRTIVAAERKLADAVGSFCWYGPTHPSDFAAQAAQVTEALLARGVAADRIAGIVARAQKRATKEGAEHTWPT